MLINMIPLIIFTALLNASAQLLLKMGMSKIGQFNFALHNLVPIGCKLVSSPFIVAGLMIYVLSVFLWLLVLSRTPVSIAYPLTSLGYIFNALGAYFIFSEHLTLFQVSGIVLIIAGVYLLAQQG